ncbi:isoprenylcysteine carboxylmethyltransferase family protein [Pseudomonas sp.]|uniref:methyltransferase family protein n=1 Tax=Pseudomonas sp. TaxID=306 RepID=UPI0027359E2C|nr:isoprenylcysteine carboxylmethyltransferase family protein [Pseudomonas sp.]MDP3814859.1 isoprenylcysteine carboxylmethyltransferase family protein [Pseudomonas sp.]
MNALENKIPPPIVAALFGLLMWGGSRYVPGIDAALSTRVVAALLAFCVGAFFCLAGVVSFRRAKTTVNPLKPETASALVSSGIYGYSRNPMYVGFAMFLMAWACYLASPLLLLGVLGFVLYINRFQIAAEERALTALFGADFVAYQTKVRRWL